MENVGNRHAAVTGFLSVYANFVGSLLGIEVLGSAILDTNCGVSIVLDVCLWVDRYKLLWLLRSPGQSWLGWRGWGHSIACMSLVSNNSADRNSGKDSEQQYSSNDEGY